MTEIRLIKEEVKKSLSKQRFIHVMGVVESCVELCYKYRVPLEPTIIAALTHDYTKENDENWNEEKLKEIGIIDAYILKTKNLWHAETASYKVKIDFSISDERILNAIKFHTIGNKKMDDISKVLYVSDAIEKGRNYEGVEELRNMNCTLNEMVLKVAKSSINHLSKNDIKISEETLKMVNYLENKINY